MSSKVFREDNQSPEHLQHTYHLFHGFQNFSHSYTTSTVWAISMSYIFTYKSIHFFYYAYCKTITSIKPRVVLYSVHIKISMELLKCKFFIHIMLNYIAGGFHFILWETEYSSFIKKENIILRSLLLYLMSTTGIKIFPTLRSGFMLSRKNRFYMHRFNRILLRVASRNYTVNEI